MTSWLFWRATNHRAHAKPPNWTHFPGKISRSNFSPGCFSARGAQIWILCWSWGANIKSSNYLHFCLILFRGLLSLKEKSRNRYGGMLIKIEWRKRRHSCPRSPLGRLSFFFFWFLLECFKQTKMGEKHFPKTCVFPRATRGLAGEIEFVRNILIYI